jgi:hypothetical protein
MDKADCGFESFFSQGQLHELSPGLRGSLPDLGSYVGFLLGFLDATYRTQPLWHHSCD